jgi:hypothetical protein
MRETRRTYESVDMGVDIGACAECERTETRTTLALSDLFSHSRFMLLVAIRRCQERFKIETDEDAGDKIADWKDLVKDIKK